MGRGGGTLGRLGKGTASASSNPPPSTSTADDVLKQKVKTMEEIDEQRKLAKAAERELKVRDIPYGLWYGERKSTVATFGIFRWSTKKV